MLKQNLLPHKLIFFAIICLLSLQTKSVLAQIPVTDLKPGQVVDRKLKGGDKDFYRFFAEAGTCSHLVVQQKGIDVAVTIKNENAETVKAVDRPSGSFGRETVTFIASQTGFYTVEISTYLSFAPIGDYQISYAKTDLPSADDVKRDLAENLTNEAEVLRSIGKAETKREAIEKFSEALKIWQNLGDGYEQAIAYYFLGYTHQTLSEFMKAAIFYNRALKIMSDLGDEFGTALNYRSIGTVQYYLNENELSVYHLKKAIEIYRRLKLERALGISLAALGAAQIVLEEYDEAIATLTESLKFRESVNDRIGKARTLFSLAKIYTNKNQFDKAEEVLSEARENLQNANQSDEAELYYFFGRLYFKTNRYEKASESLRKALVLYEQTGNKLGEANVLLEISRVEFKRQNLDYSLENARASIEIIERLRQSTYDFRKRVKFTATIQPFYENYILILMSRHQRNPTRGFDKIALQISEQARFRGLLDQLERRNLIRQGKIDLNLLETEQKLREQLLNVLSLSDAENEKQQKIQQISAERLEIESKIDQTAQGLQNENVSQILSAVEIQKKLDDDTVLLEYAVIAEESFLWLVTNGEIKSYNLGSGDEIDAASEKVYECISTAWKADTKAVCLQKIERLSKILLPPIIKNLEGKKLVIVKHGFLQYIPFSVLLTSQKDDKTNRISQKFLIETNEIISLPSASILQFIQRAKNRDPQKTIAVFADPVYSPADIRLENSLNSQTKGREILPRLFASRFEAENISSFAPPRDILIKTDFDANLSSVFDADLDDYKIVHFAAHALLNDRQPELSAVILSFYDPKGDKINGFLHSDDILMLDLSADLVVLSSCQSGLGRQIRGEGLTSISHSFFTAGSKRLLASLWNVDDKVTADFMTKFYRKYFRGNKNFSTALAETQRETIKDKRRNSPFYWSAFTLQGVWK